MVLPYTVTEITSMVILIAMALMLWSGAISYGWHWSSKQLGMSRMKQAIKTLDSLVDSADMATFTAPKKDNSKSKKA